MGYPNDPGRRPDPVPQPGPPPVHFPPAPFPPNPFPPQGPGPYAGGPPAPRPRRGPLIAGLLGAVVVTAVAAVLTVAQWRASVPTVPAGTTAAETTASFPLGGSVSVSIRLPAGWEAVADVDDGRHVVVIRAAGDRRALSAITADLTALGQSGIGDPVHAVVVFTGSCAGASPTVGAWRSRIRDDSSRHHTENWLYATSKVDRRGCLNLSGTDAAAGPAAAGSQARDLVRRLIREDRLSTGTPI